MNTVIQAQGNVHFVVLNMLSIQDNRTVNVNVARQPMGEIYMVIVEINTLQARVLGIIQCVIPIPDCVHAHGHVQMPLVLVE